MLCAPRFLWVVQYFVGAGFYVIPTYSPSDYSVDSTVASTPAVFLRNWANLWSAITEVGTVAGCPFSKGGPSGRIPHGCSACCSCPCWILPMVSCSQLVGGLPSCVHGA